jgi:hypothetical protein
VAAISAGAASGPSRLVPSRAGGFPDWLAGPLSGLGLGTSDASYQALLLVVCACYVVVLACLPALGPRRVVGAIVLAHVALVLGPPLLSGDVFGYLDYARLGVLHGLDPYTSTSSAAPQDEVYRFVLWHNATSPYGPLFTLASYPLAEIGVPAGLWVLKLLAGASSLGALALLWRCAQRRGRRPVEVVAFVGANPVILLYGVGGAHNDTLLMAGAAATVLLALRGRPAAAGVASVLAAGLKASAGLVTPFVILGSDHRRRTLLAVVGTLAVLGVLAAAIFGAHAVNVVEALRGQQGLVAVHSVPAQLGRLLGAPHLESGLRTLFVVGAVGALGWALLATWRGADWVTMTGWATLALLVGTAWLLPWYVMWLAPFSALSADRRLRGATLGFCAYVVVSRLPMAEGLTGGVL